MSKAQEKKEEKPKLPEQELSEEDKEKKANFDMMVERLQDNDQSISKTALDKLSEEVQSAASSITSVKFLNPHYQTIKDFFAKCREGQFKQELADLLSVLGITMSEEGSFDALNFALLGTKQDLSKWGGEYLRSLSGEVGERKKTLEEGDNSLDFLIDTISKYFMEHHEESEAVDLLIEVDQISKLIPVANDHNYKRVCQYLKSCGPYAADQEDMEAVYTTTYEIYMKLKQYTDALLVAQKLNKQEFINRTMEECQDPVVKRQLCIMLGRARSNWETEDEDLQQIISCEKLSEYFKSLGKELDVLKPKEPEKVFKSHLEDKKPDEAALESHKVNLSITYANQFINCGFGTDTIMLNEEEEKKEGEDQWVWKNKDSGQTAAAASVGMLVLWDIDEGFSVIDKYMESTNDLIRAGAYMAVGLVNSGIRNENDPVFALLSDKLGEGTEFEKIGALMGLSFTYAGTCREDLLEIITPMILDGDNSIELVSVAAMVAGFIFQGSCDENCVSTITQTLMERDPSDLDSPHARYLALGLGLLFFGKQDQAEAVQLALSVIDHPIKRYIEILVEGCAYASTGNVLKIQEMLHIISDEVKVAEDDKNKNHFQSVAVLSLALIAFGDDIGQDMCRRVLNHAIHYGESEIKQAIPLALGLLGITKPQSAYDTLSKLAYDSDQKVAINALLSLGIIYSGTNNSRLAGSLRTLASYYNKEPNALFMVRIAQGISHMGKGLVNIQPIHSDKFLQNNLGLGGILALFLSTTAQDDLFFKRMHVTLNYLVFSMYPRMMITLDKDMNQVKIPV